MKQNNTVEPVPIPWIDTHCHLDLPPLSDRLEEIIDRAFEAGVAGFVVPAVAGPLQPVSLPKCALRAWGVHPGNAHRFEAENMRALFSSSAYRPDAIGECGLDREAPASFSHQREIFLVQIELANENRLPLLIHVRGFWNEGLAILKHREPFIPCVMHAFSGSAEMARLFLRSGIHTSHLSGSVQEKSLHSQGNLFLSFAGSLCMPQARKTPRVARECPEDAMVLETDAPDLRPIGWSFPDNEPGAIPLIAARMAALRGVPVESLRQRIFENTQRIFGAEVWRSPRKY